MKVSVIISTFNRWDLLKRAVDSVLNQTYENLECIVVDDCSTDPRYNGNLSTDPRVSFIRLKENMGKKYNMICAQGMTRNEGLKIATGKYVAFLDDDDWWEPEKIQIQVKLLEDNPSYEICGTNAYHHTPKGVSPYFNKYIPMVLNLADMMKVNLYIHSSVMATRKIVEVVGCFDAVKNEDYELWKKIFKRTNGIFINQCLTHYWDMGQGWRLKIE